LLVAAGCPESVDPPANVLDGNRDQTVTSPIGKTSGEPNNTFAEPIVAVFDGEGVARLQGTVTRRGDLDVFHLGALRAGDRITVDATTPGSDLDVSVALFDSEQRVVIPIDDKCETGDAACLDAFFEIIMRHESATSFLVVTNSSFSASGRTAGSYSVDITVSGGFEVPAPREQILVLDFDGARLNSDVLGRGELAPFDTGEISARYEGQTEVVIEQIIDVMRQNYERFNVTIERSGERPFFDSTMTSIIFFGGFNPAAFGLAENVDVYNVDFCDDAIIFAESFTTGVFSFPPSAEELGIAIGNVASHEAGHLLGLNHVDDDTDLMDDRSLADVFLDNQEFKQSVLSSDIIPIGTQDGALLLFETVGQAEE